MLALLLSGCATHPPMGDADTNKPDNKPPPSDPTSPQQATLTGQQREALDALLLRAEDALKDHRLLTPISNCAYDYYQAALAIDGHNAEGLKGLQQVVEGYLDLALKAARNSRFGEADKLLKRARIALSGLKAWQVPEAVNYSAANLASVEHSIQMLRGADRHRLLIEGQALSSRAENLSRRLADFGRQAKKPGMRVVILAPSDNDGRWIYQQLRKAPGEFRIRGEIQIGIPAQVELLALQPIKPTPSPSETPHVEADFEADFEADAETDVAADVEQ